MGNENEIFAVYKRNSVTEWLQKTGQFTDVNVNNGKSFDNYKNCSLSLTFSVCFMLCMFVSERNGKFVIFRAIYCLSPLLYLYY